MKGPKYDSHNPVTIIGSEGKEASFYLYLFVFVTEQVNNDP